jgi:NADH-quinone oxidoreductase subunit J
MTTDLAIFLGLAAISTLAGISMLISRNAIYSALFLVLNFLAVATLYLLLNAAFIAMVQITVYAGAIMVLFLFVIMLLGPARDQLGGPFRWQLPVALLLGVGLMFELGFVMLARSDGLANAVASLGEGFGSPASVGRLLFSEYLVPFEITSVLLLVAMIGAIVLTRVGRREGR